MRNFDDWTKWTILTVTYFNQIHVIKYTIQSHKNSMVVEQWFYEFPSNEKSQKFWLFTKLCLDWLQ